MVAGLSRRAANDDPISVAPVDERRRGTAFGLSAYLIWGLFPLYWRELDGSGAVEVLAQRVVWSLAFCAVLVLALRRRTPVLAVLRDRRLVLRLSVAAVLIAVNWGTFIYAVNSGHVIETSLGYFMNPLVSVALGVVVLGERLRPFQWWAIGGAAAGVVVLTVENGSPPWLALTLAASFGTYGLMKKQTAINAVDGLTVETLVLAPVALAFLLVLGLRGDSTFASEGPVHTLLLVGTGVVTAVPLLLFSGAATRVPLTVIGLLQYVTPTMQFLLGVLVFHESLPAARLCGFVLVWAALAAYSADAFANRRRQPVMEPV